MKLSRKVQTYLIAFLFLGLPLILLGIFTYYPIIKGITLSFANYNVITGKAHWVGLRNYRYILGDPYFSTLFWTALTNSFKYILVVPFIQFGSILLAVLVNKKFPGVNAARAIFYVPVVTGGVITSLVWGWIFQEHGILNFVLMQLRMISKPILWLNDPKVALFSCMTVTFWKGLGYYMVIYLAGLKNISSELYEAAALDGANAWHQLWRITLPLLRPSMLLCFTLSTLSALKVFEEVYLITKGGGNTSTMLFEIYNLAFNQFQFSRAAAMSVIFSFILLGVMVINFKFFGVRRGVKR